MPQLKILNDTHLGVKRMAGTTPASQLALKQWLLQNFTTAVHRHDSDLMILGDLFDSYNVCLSDVVSVFHTFVDYCADHPDAEIYVVAGNHDLSKTSTTLSAFSALQQLLKHNKQMTFITEPTMTKYGYVIPHVVNQEVFDQHLAAVPPTEYLFLHCNYDNFFAAQSDHSLNLSEEIAQALPVKHIIMGHEHVREQVGKVWIPGVQWPTAVSECARGSKSWCFATLQKKGPQFVSSGIAVKYQEVEVFSPVAPDAQFVRVVGELPKDRLGDALRWFNDIRKTSSAFVITNAIQFTDGDATISLENVGTNIESFQVLSAIRETLTPAELTLLDSVC